MADSDTDPSKPLREVLTDEQIQYLREESSVENLNSILDSSLNELMKSSSKPDLTQLMSQATGQPPADTNGNNK